MTEAPAEDRETARAAGLAVRETSGLGVQRIRQRVSAIAFDEVAALLGGCTQRHCPSKRRQVGEGNANSDTELLSPLSGDTVKANITRLAATQNLDIQWLESIDPESLRYGLLSGEACRKVLARTALSLAVRKLAGMKELSLKLRGSLKPVE